MTIADDATKAIRSFICLSALVVAQPISAEEEPVLDLQSGDVLCIGYDADSHSCAQAQIVSDRNGDVIQWLAMAVLVDVPPAMTSVMSTQTKIIGARHCIVNGSTDVQFDPPDHSMSYIHRISTLGIAKEFEKRNSCSTYRRCGNKYAAILYFGEERAPEWDMVFTYFSGQDEETSKLLVRRTYGNEVLKYMGNVAQECLPVT